MTLIVNLVGASGSGKTSVAKELEKLGYNVLQSYTTRSPRHKDEWGHIFIDNNDVIGWQNHIFSTVDMDFHRKDMVAYAQLYDKHYFITDDQILRNQINIYVVDPGGAEDVHDYYKYHDDIKVITIFLQTDESVRAERLANRISDQGKRKYIEDKHLSEVWARLYPDRKIFKNVKTNYVINANRSLKKVVREVDKIIIKEED